MVVILTPRQSQMMREIEAQIRALAERRKELAIFALESAGIQGYDGGVIEIDDGKITVRGD